MENLEDLHPEFRHLHSNLHRSYNPVSALLSLTLSTLTDYQKHLRVGDWTSTKERTCARIVTYEHNISKRQKIQLLNVFIRFVC